MTPITFALKHEEPLSWATLVLYSLANAGVNMVNAFTNAALPLFLGTYHLPATLIGFLAQERSFVGGFIQPVVGAISDRLRTPLGKRKPFFLVGVPLTAGSLFLLSTYPPLWAVLGVLLFLAFFLAVANDPYLALMPDITPTAQRGRVGAAMALFNMLGQMAMLVIAMLWWERSPALVFHLVGGGLILTFAVTFLTIPEPPAGPTPPKPGGLSPIRYAQDVLRYREMAKYVLSQGFFWFGTGGAVPFITRFGVEVLGTDESTAFELFLWAVASTAVFAVPAGLAGDRLGKKRVLSFGLAFMAATALVGSQTQTAEQGRWVMAFLGIGNAAVTTLGFPLLTDLMPPDRRGEFTGLGSLVWSLSQPLGSTAAGLTVDLTGSYRSFFFLTSLMVFASFLGLQTVRPERALAGAASSP